MSNSAQTSASSRIAALLDENSFVEVGAYIAARNTDFNMTEQETPADGVVTGYGTFKKASFTGAASTVNTSTLEDVPVLSVADKLSGNVAGVTFGSSSSNPGSVSSIRVRGMGSINAGNNPLYVIDGTPVTSGDLSEFTYSDAGTDILSSLNTNDIESITVIKDAAAASLYGSRAANGVVVITTKSGKQGKTNVSFRSDWGFSNMAIDYRPMLDGDSRRELLWTGLKNYGLYTGNMSDADAATFADQNIEDFASKPSTGWTDWKDLLFRNGSHQNYQLSVSGGNAVPSSTPQLLIPIRKVSFTNKVWNVSLVMQTSLISLETLKFRLQANSQK